MSEATATNNLQKTRSKLRWTTTVFFFISGVVTATWASRIPEMQQKFRLNDAEWGMVLFAMSIGLAAGLSVASWLVEKFSSPRMMTISGIIYLILLCLLAVSPTVLTLAITLFLFGVSRNITNLANNTNSVEVQRLYKKPVLARFHGIWSLACLAAAALGTLFINLNIEPFYHFLILAVASVLLILLFKRRTKRLQAVAPGRKPFFIKPDRYLFLLGLIALCGMMCEGVMFDWSVNYYVKVVNPDKAYVTAGYTAFIITMSAGRFVGDKLIEKLGPVRLLMINGIMITSGFYVVVMFPQVVAATLGFLLIGAGISIVVPLLFILAGRTDKMPANYAIASVTLIGYIGFLSGPLVVGSITEAYGMQVAFAVIGLVAAGISIIAWYMKKNALVV
ncbi:MFS transporter [Aridibaculum aurantiacum]|uniref:MFS transporter n=1 Tax=Aridibaculum aurantiacum TaxID=2810307 RepID=UPI001A962DF3|nr:MFS transporter [Aridibaculum aurantiacum]